MSWFAASHEDHTGGLGALIDNFHPAQLWTGANGKSAVWRELRTKGVSRYLKIDSMRSGRSFDFGDTGKNNDSLVLGVAYDNIHFS